MLGREKRWKEGRLEGERGDEQQDGMRDAGKGEEEMNKTEQGMREKGRVRKGEGENRE